MVTAIALGRIFSLMILTLLSSTVLLAHAPPVNAWAGTTTTPMGLNSVFCVSSSDCWAVGDNGLILHWSGSQGSWSIVPSPTANNLNSISCVGSSDCWAVGDGGTIIHTGGIFWGSVASPTTNNLNSISCTSSSDCWAVGNSGTIVRVPLSPVDPLHTNNGSIGGTQGSSGSNPMTADLSGTVTVRLLESRGSGLNGGEVQWFNGSWHSFGTTGADGSVGNKLPSGNYNFRMTYAGGQIEKWQNVQANQIVVFQTVNVVVQLKNSLGNGISGGVVEYYGGSWRNIGTTDSSGMVTVELLAVTYGFSMDYNHAHNEKWQNVLWSPNVIFQIG